MTGAAQKQIHVEVSQDMLDSTNSDPDFMYTIITGGKCWVYGYDPETKFNKNTTPPHSNACHQLMLLTGEKNSCMHMKVQGRLMQVPFIEIHQVFGRKKKGRILF